MLRKTQVQLAEEAKAKVERERARLDLERLRLRRENIKARRTMLAVHRAAEQNRFTKDWISPNTSADSETVPDLARITARARQVIRDDPWAKSIIRSFRRNVIGTGITPSDDGGLWFNPWSTWANASSLVDLERRRNLIEIQHWAISELVAVGEAFIVRWVVQDPDGGRRIRLQCFEIEQLENYRMSDPGTGNEIRHGIEVDDRGAAVAYHFWKHHPHDIRGLARPQPITMDSVRVPASMVCHVYDPERARQTHGISRLAPVLRKLRDLTEYDAAQLRVARAEASIGLLIKGGDDAVEPLELDGLNVAYLGDDESVTPFTPTRPGNTYDPFVRAQLKAIAAGVGISYDQIARDFDSGSFSSKRVASLEDRREFQYLQDLIITRLLEPVLNDYLMLNPAISGDYWLRPDPVRVSWQGQGWDWVDPEAQGKAIERQIRLGLATRTDEANKLGRSVRQIDRIAATDGTKELAAKLIGDGRENPAPDSASNPADDVQVQEVANE